MLFAVEIVAGVSKPIKLLNLKVNPFAARPKKNIIPPKTVENSQYRMQHYMPYHGYKYSLLSVAGFIRQSGDYYLFTIYSVVQKTFQHDVPVTTVISQ